MRKRSAEPLSCALITVILTDSEAGIQDKYINFDFFQKTLAISSKVWYDIKAFEIRSHFCADEG